MAIVIATTRRYEFESVHELDLEGLREAKHGHRFQLEVTFRGASVDVVDQLVEKRVLSRLQARELGAEFQPATGEVLVEWIHTHLESLGPQLLGVAIQETRKNRFVSARSEVRLV